MVREEAAWVIRNQGNSLTPIFFVMFISPPPFLTTFYLPPKKAVFPALKLQLLPVSLAYIKMNWTNTRYPPSSISDLLDMLFDLILTEGDIITSVLQTMRSELETLSKIRQNYKIKFYFQFFLIIIEFFQPSRIYTYCLSMLFDGIKLDFHFSERSGLFYSFLCFLKFFSSQSTILAFLKL